MRVLSGYVDKIESGNTPRVTILQCSRRSHHVHHLVSQIGSSSRSSSPISLNGNHPQDWYDEIPSRRHVSSICDYQADGCDYLGAPLSSISIHPTHASILSKRIPVACLGRHREFVQVVPSPWATIYGILASTTFKYSILVKIDQKGL